MDFRADILVFGSGDSAGKTAEWLSLQGIDVLLAPLSDAKTSGQMQNGAMKRVRIIAGARLNDCRGHAGAFELLFDVNGERKDCAVAGIVIAEDALYTPNFPAYSLQPSERVISLSQAEARLAKKSSASSTAERFAFLNSWQSDSDPAIATRMLRLGLQVQKSGGHSVYLTGNLKVAENGMEACYQEAKAAGTVFLKFSDRPPRIKTLNDGRIRIDYWDETTRMDFRMTADCVVVDESVQAHPALAQLADVLRLDRDAAGYLQSDNVRRLSHLTNRRGIFVTGGSRGISGLERHWSDAEYVAFEASCFLRCSQNDARPGVQIDQGRCARCLTCYRLCPYAAIDTTPRMTIVTQACQSCGICAAGCPNQAIHVDAPGFAAALQNLPRSVDMRFADGPKIVAFCCSRSAAQAREAAVSMGHRLPPGMLFIEGLCGGSFSVNHMLSAFEAGIDGIMLLACHPGNCHSESGTINAAKRAEQVVKALSAAGIEPERVAYGTLAANMGMEFFQMADSFSHRIATLGPLYGQPQSKRIQQEP